MFQSKQKTETRVYNDQLCTYSMLCKSVLVHMSLTEKQTVSEMNRAVCDLLCQVVDHCRLHKYQIRLRYCVLSFMFITLYPSSTLSFVLCSHSVIFYSIWFLILFVFVLFLFCTTFYVVSMCNCLLLFVFFYHFIIIVIFSENNW